MNLLAPSCPRGTLADVVPSLLAGLRVPGMTNVLGLPGASRVCLLLVDGLGWRLLRSHEAEAPFLSSLTADREPITAGFPATTATSIATLGTGVPSGEHGIVGYTFAAGPGELLNTLRWQRHGEEPPVDLRTRIVPERLQPRPTVFERATDAGVAVRLVAPHAQDASGFTRAVLRGGRFRGVHALGDLASHVLDALHDHDRVFCYAYHGDLDTLGHIYGPGSMPWRQQLAVVDHLAATITMGLPTDSMLLITADHGMVSGAEGDQIDLDTEPLLRDGVRMLGGEARVRYVYTEPSATDDVWRAWHDVLGTRALVTRRDDAIDMGWFGPRVAAHIRPRIGDLVVAALDNFTMVRSEAEPTSSRFIGHHGSLTPDEQLIPLLLAPSSD